MLIMHLFSLFRYMSVCVCLYTIGINGQELTRRQIISHLLNTSRYDSNTVPEFDEEYPTNVTIQVTIHDMYSISESTMEYSIDMYLRMWWRDKRLDFSTMSNKSKLELDSKYVSNVWQPDVFFENEKRGSVHTVTTSNKLMHIASDGTVVYSVRLSLALGCAMLLKYYPFDSQRCPLFIQSFGYTKEHINLNWYHPNPITTEHLEMPQFTLDDDATIVKDYETLYSGTGIFSTLKAELLMTRKVGFHFLQVFIPSVLLVVLSWVSFWVDPSAVPARVSLGVTCVLTMTTQSSGIRHSLPPVSYVKAIDVWMFVCLLFVFSALLEFAYVNVLLRSKPEKTKSSGAGVDSQGDAHIQADGPSEQLTILDIITKQFNIPAPDVKTKAVRVDIISRFLFPISFTLFLFVFFMLCGLAPLPILVGK